MKETLIIKTEHSVKVVTRLKSLSAYSIRKSGFVFELEADS